jgi:2-iminobutanoate/2-iminopropanoate deaminase
MTMEYIRRGAAPGAPYVSAVVTEGRLVFVSGQTPSQHGQIVAGTITQQTERVMANISAILDAAGAGLNDVVRCGVFLADLADLAEFNEAYKKAFGGRMPARTAVGANLPGYGVEIDCIAAPIQPSPTNTDINKEKEK